MVKAFLIVLLSTTLLSCSKDIDEKNSVTCPQLYRSFPMEQNSTECSAAYTTNSLTQDFNKVELSSPSIYKDSPSLQIYTGQDPVTLDFTTQSLLYIIYETDLQTKVTKKKKVEIDFSNDQTISEIFRSFFKKFYYCSYTDNTSPKPSTSALTPSLTLPIFLNFFNNNVMTLTIGAHNTDTFCKSSHLDEVELMFKHTYLLAPNKVVLSEEVVP